MKKLILISWLLMAAVTSINAEQGDFPSRKLSGLNGPCLGQKPPGMTPETGLFDKKQDVFGLVICTMTKKTHPETENENNGFHLFTGLPVPQKLEVLTPVLLPCPWQPGKKC